MINTECVSDYIGHKYTVKCSINRLCEREFVLLGKDAGNTDSLFMFKDRGESMN